MIGQIRRFAAVGLEMGIAVAVGTVFGYWLDQKFDTKPLFFWIGFGLGVGAATKALIEVAFKVRKALDKDESSSSDKN